jgi:hypothetical protein
MTAVHRLAFLALACSFTARPAFADENASSKELDTLYETVERLEHRIDELESSSAKGSDRMGHVNWSERIRLSGSSELNYLQGGDYGIFDRSSTQIYDARVFLDADLGSDARIGDTTVYRDAGFTFEWNLIRLGYTQNDVGDLYVDLRGLMAQDWLNLEVGRFQIPFGENYLRFGRGRKDDPFVALSASPPWFWDEGVKLWGKSGNGHLGYVASVTDGEGGINVENNSSKQVTLKLIWDPSEWLHLSASGLRTGKLGSTDTPAFGAVWLGEAFPSAFGTGANAPSFDHGALLPNGPNQLDNVYVVGGDAVVNLPNVRFWLSGGDARIDSSGASVYDRDLIYWLAEAVVQLRMISPLLDPVYLALRANGLGTYDNDQGYLLDFRYGDVGYNMRSLDTYAIALGVPLGDHITLKAQYTLQNINLVRGITDPEILEGADNADFFGMEIGVHF